MRAGFLWLLLFIALLAVPARLAPGRAALCHACRNLWCGLSCVLASSGDSRALLPEGARSAPAQRPAATTWREHDAACVAVTRGREGATGDGAVPSGAAAAPRPCRCSPVVTMLRRGGAALSAPFFGGPTLAVVARPKKLCYAFIKKNPAELSVESRWAALASRWQRGAPSRGPAHRKFRRRRACAPSCRARCAGVRARPPRTRLAWLV